MRPSRLVALSAAVPLLLVGASVGSHADDISNNLDDTVDAVAEVMPLSVGGGTGTTELYVVPTNGDGKQGCNLTGGTTYVASVASSNTSVATVSPSTVTFDSCNARPTLTVTPHSQGTATVSLTQTSNTTLGSFNVNPARFTVNVGPPANTPPQVSVSGVEAGADYAKGSVPAATCQVTDAEDGNPSFAATLSAVNGPYASDGIGEQTASCSYTDGGGATAVASKTYTISDPTAPVVGYTLTPPSPDGSNGWYLSDVTLTWSVTEPESPNSLQTTGCDNQSVTSDQALTDYTCSATSAGGDAAEETVSIKRDGTSPTVGLVGGPVHNGSYYFGGVPAAPTCNGSDVLSGLDGSCSVAGYSTALGTHTVGATATDNAGNEGTASATYSVLSWTVGGFYAPVDMGGVYNTVKGGSTVPLKFKLSAGTTELTDTSAVSGFAARKISCVSGATEDAIEMTSTGGTSLRYDTTAKHFVQNWKTPTGAGSCYSATMTAADGSFKTAYFKLR